MLGIVLKERKYQKPGSFFFSFLNKMFKIFLAASSEWNFFIRIGFFSLDAFSSFYLNFDANRSMLVCSDRSWLVHTFCSLCVRSFSTIATKRIVYTRYMGIHKNEQNCENKKKMQNKKEINGIGKTSVCKKIHVRNTERTEKIVLCNGLSF